MIKINHCKIDILRFILYIDKFGNTGYIIKTYPTSRRWDWQIVHLLTRGWQGQYWAGESDKWTAEGSKYIDIAAIWVRSHLTDVTQLSQRGVVGWGMWDGTGETLLFIWENPGIWWKPCHLKTLNTMGTWTAFWPLSYLPFCFEYKIWTNKCFFVTVMSKLTKLKISKFHRQISY